MNNFKDWLEKIEETCTSTADVAYVPMRLGFGSKEKVKKSAGSFGSLSKQFKVIAPQPLDVKLSK